MAVAAEEEEVDNVARAEALSRRSRRRPRWGRSPPRERRPGEPRPQTRAEKDLFATQVEALCPRIALQLQARADALAALASSRAFLHRGFRDIGCCSRQASPKP